MDFGTHQVGFSRIRTTEKPPIGDANTAFPGTHRKIDLDLPISHEEQLSLWQIDEDAIFEIGRRI